MDRVPLPSLYIYDFVLRNACLRKDVSIAVWFFSDLVMLRITIAALKVGMMKDEDPVKFAQFFHVPFAFDDFALNSNALQEIAQFSHKTHKVYNGSIFQDRHLHSQERNFCR